MKTNYILFLFVLLFSCEKYDEVHLDYIDSENEVKYSVMPKDTRLHPGLNRMGVSCKLLYTSSLEKYVVAYNDEKIEVEMPAPINDTVFINHVIPNLTEGVIDVTIYSQDNEGNPSISETLTSKVLGENYRKNILNRNISDTLSTDSSFIVKFLPAPENVVRLDFSYTNINDVENLVRVSAESSQIEVKDYKKGSEYSYVTYYLPNPMAIDTISTSSKVVDNFPL
jgi:hypothetical protein